jgi:protein FAM50
MTDIRRVGDSGVHTVEGVVAGARAARLTKQRDKEAAEYEAEKNKIKEQNSAAVGRIDEKFNAVTDVVENEFRRRTVGLVSADDFRKARECLVEAVSEGEKRQREREEEASARRKEERALKRKKMAATLSFAVDDDEEAANADGDEAAAARGSGAAVATITTTTSSSSSATAATAAAAPVIAAKVKKDPTADAAFLPDRDRDLAQQAERERLRQEWLAQQDVVKNEMLEITYSYWDGIGHRKVIQVRKGTTVARFLELVKQQVAAEFNDMKYVAPESLLYVKEDLIIPHHVSFYDLIVTKARGKSGPLFHFDVHDDVRLLSDATVEKDESHPGKVVQRSWYERNKHIFPASRWEVYDPNVARDGVGYTIHGGEVNKKS